MAMAWRFWPSRLIPRFIVRFGLLLSALIGAVIWLGFDVYTRYGKAWFDTYLVVAGIIFAIIALVPAGVSAFREPRHGKNPAGGTAARSALMAEALADALVSIQVADAQALPIDAIFGEVRGPAAVRGVRLADVYVPLDVTDLGESDPELVNDPEF